MVVMYVPKLMNVQSVIVASLLIWEHAFARREHIWIFKIKYASNALHYASTVLAQLLSSVLPVFMNKIEY